MTPGLHFWARCARLLGSPPPSWPNIVSLRLPASSCHYRGHHSLSFSYRTPRHRLVILSIWVGSDSPLPWLLSEVTQVVVWRAMLALSGNATGFRPTVVVWLKTFQRDMCVRVYTLVVGRWRHLLKAPVPPSAASAGPGRCRGSARRQALWLPAAAVRQTGQLLGRLMRDVYMYMYIVHSTVLQLEGAGATELERGRTAGPADRSSPCWPGTSRLS